MASYTHFTQEKRILLSILEKKGKYRRRYGTKISKKQRDDARKTRINKRPKIIEERERLGDFEGDIVIGKEAPDRL